MANIIRVLAQLYPTAATETTLYTCATTNGAVVSSLVVCNTSATPDTFSVRVNVAGAGNANDQIVFHTSPISGNTTVSITIGITVANTDVIKVTSTNGTCAFNLFGQESS